MNETISIGPLSQIPLGEGRTFDVGGKRLAVFHTRGGGVFATQASCPHRGGPLADGLTGGTTLICPLHEYTYDLATGAGIGHPECLTVYPVHVENGAVMVAMPMAVMA